MRVYRSRRYGQRRYRAGINLGTVNRLYRKKQNQRIKAVVRRNQELKYQYFNQGAVGISNSASFSGSPFDVPQGITDLSRIGDQITLCGRIYFKGQFVVSDTTNVIRMMVIQWFENSAFRTPAVTDFLLPGPSGNPDIYSQYAHDTRSLYRVLCDKTFTFVGNGTAGTYPGTTSCIRYKNFSIPIKKARKKINYFAASTDGTNRLFIMFVSDSSAINHPTVEYSTKMFFRDG